MADTGVWLMERNTDLELIYVFCFFMNNRDLEGK